MRIYFLLLFLSGSCSYAQVDQINYRSKNILDINVKTGKLIYFCSLASKDDSRRFLNIYLMNSDRTDLFFTRRKLEAQECLQWVQEIDDIYKNSKFLRIVGIEGTEEPYLDKELSDYIHEKNPVKVSSLWYFSRVVTDKGCVGHFGGECTQGYSEKKRFLE